MNKIKSIIIKTFFKKDVLQLANELNKASQDANDGCKILTSTLSRIIENPEINDKLVSEIRYIQKGVDKVLQATDKTITATEYLTSLIE